MAELTFVVVVVVDVVVDAVVEGGVGGLPLAALALLLLFATAVVAFFVGGFLISACVVRFCSIF